MLINSKDIADEVLTTEVCIIGSGMGGAPLALELLNNNKSLILIEAGGNNLNNGAITDENVGADFNMEATRTFEIGGGSCIWAGGLAKFERDDLESNAREWPIKFKELDEYYCKAGRLFGLPDSDFSIDSLNNKRKNELETIKFSKSFIYNKLYKTPKPIFSFKKLLQNGFRHHKSSHLIYNAPALELVFNNGSISLLKFGTSKGIKFIKAKSYIVSAGALESPRLMLNSGIPNSNIGKNLMDHPKCYIGELELVRSRMKKNNIYAFMLDENYGVQIKTSLVLNEKVRIKQKLLNHSVYIRPIIRNLNVMRKVDDVGTRVHCLKNSKNRIRDSLSLFKEITTIMYGLAYKYGSFLRYKKMGVFLVGEQTESFESQVTLSDIRDCWGYRIAKIEWNIGEEDLDNIIKFGSFLSSHLNDCVYDTTKLDKQYLKKHLASAAHHCGTCRIGYDGDDSVVDKDLKVHGVENLYICDASVFKTSGNVNPSYSIAALSLRLADKLLGRE